MIEVFCILVCTDPGAHGGDVKAEQGTADGAKGCKDVYVGESKHVAAVSTSWMKSKGRTWRTLVLAPQKRLTLDVEL